MSLRDIAAKLAMTYYQVQKISSAAWMIVVTHYRTISLGGYDFQVRMLPMAVALHRMNKEIAAYHIQSGRDLIHAVELRVGNSAWLDFDPVRLEGIRAEQIEYFYNKLVLPDFAKSVAMNLDFALTMKTFEMFVVFFKKPDAIMENVGTSSLGPL
jgi:hypothetical protein